MQPVSEKGHEDMAPKPWKDEKAPAKALGEDLALVHRLERF